MSIKGDVWSLTQKIHKMSQTLSLLEKSMNPGFPKLKPDVSSPQAKMLGFDDSCQEGGCSGFQRWGSFGTDGTGASQNLI